MVVGASAGVRHAVRRLSDAGREPLRAGASSDVACRVRGVFIGMSFLWGRIFDGMKLDMGDLIGSLLCLAGVIVIMAWPGAREVAHVVVLHGGSMNRYHDFTCTWNAAPFSGHLESRWR